MIISNMVVAGILFNRRERYLRSYITSLYPSHCERVLLICAAGASWQISLTAPEFYQLFLEKKIYQVCMAPSHHFFQCPILLPSMSFLSNYHH
jgi:hypothetical protein